MGDPPSGTTAEPKRTPLQWVVGALVIICVVALVGGIGYFVFNSSWAPIIIVAILWFACYSLFAKEKKPWRHARFATSLLTAWVADAVLFRLAAVNAPNAYRHFVPGIVIVSIFVGYLAWEVLDEQTRPYTVLVDDLASTKPPRRETREPKAAPGAGFGSFLLAMFLMVNVVVPAVGHFFPTYWHNISQQLNSDNDEQDPGP